MNKETVFIAASRSLVARHGLTPDDAWEIITKTRRWQAEEWDRILQRCQSGNVSQIYIVSVRDEEVGPLSALVYAPAERDNVKHVMDFASQGPIGSDEPVFRYYPVSCFEVGSAVKHAVAIEVERDGIINEVKHGRL
jgi:hypothetical protein